jgi:putative NADPH-quinone reductase
MAKKIVAIVGSYRRSGTVDSAVDRILDGAREGGAEAEKIRLLDRNIGFCTNCRSCTQKPGPARGICVQNDDMESVLSKIEEADAVVFAAPVNFYNVTALFRRFMERLVGYAFWPWNVHAGPRMRVKRPLKKAVLVASAGMPGLLIPLATGAPRALKSAARTVGAKPVHTLWIGLAGHHPVQPLSPRIAARAKAIGMRLSAGGAVNPAPPKESS